MKFFIGECVVKYRTDIITNYDIFSIDDIGTIAYDPKTKMVRISGILQYYTFMKTNTCEEYILHNDDVLKWAKQFGDEFVSKYFKYAPGSNEIFRIQKTGIKKHEMLSENFSFWIHIAAVEKFIEDFHWIPSGSNVCPFEVEPKKICAGEQYSLPSILKQAIVYAEMYKQAGLEYTALKN